MPEYVNDKPVQGYGWIGGKAYLVVRNEISIYINGGFNLN